MTNDPLAQDGPAARSGAPTADLSWPELRQFFPHRKIGTYIIPVPEYDLVYVKNPKSACSTLLAWLDRLHTGEHDAELPNIHKNHRLPTVREVGPREVVRMLSGAAYRFSFVRNPLRRFESAYWNKIVHSRGWRSRNLPESMGLPRDPEAVIGFEEFLAAVEAQDPVSEMDPHWRPQHVNLMHPVVSYDRIGHLESFEADLKLIREEAGLPDVPVQAWHRSSRSSTDSVYNGRPDLVGRVERLFATDFELYGY